MGNAAWSYYSKEVQIVTKYAVSYAMITFFITILNVSLNFSTFLNVFKPFNFLQRSLRV